MNKAPAFQFYPDKALAGTVHLSGEAFKAYWRVVWWMWLHGKNHCQMPDTETAWRIATGIDGADRLNAARDEIMDPCFPLFKKRAGVLTNNGLKKESKKQAKTRTVRSNAAKARWDKELQQSKSTANASNVQCLPSPSPSPITATHKNRITETQKKRIRVKENTDAMIRIGAMFGRKPSTLWSVYEAEALDQLGDISEDIESVAEFYGADIPQSDDYRRKSIETLLNNWNGEVDKARAFRPKAQGRAF